MIRIGVDVIGVARMAAAVERSGQSFLNRVFTPAEMEHCGGSAERLAGRWAAKEAVIKSLEGSGLLFARRQIEILAQSSGAPEVRLLGDSRGARVQVSITHDHGLAVAAALLEMPDQVELAEIPDALGLPPRPPEGHKGTFGTVVALAGSPGLTGAAYLTSTAAARAGAGMVKLLVAETIYPILAVKCTEVMATPVAEVTRGVVGHISLEGILRHFASARAGVVGPGLGRDRSTVRLVHDLVAQVGCPLVLDADALNALAEQPRSRGRLGPGRVLTPHPGEMSRLLRRSIVEVEADRLDTARQAAADWQSVVVLKGANTVVAAPDGRISIDPHVVPALASGGTGDVLAGTIAGLLAQGSDPFTAAVTGVYVHACAGRLVARRLGDAGLLASDLLAELPVVIDALRKRGG